MCRPHLPLFALQLHTFPPQPSAGWLPIPQAGVSTAIPALPARPTNRARPPTARSRTQVQQLGRDGLPDARAPARDDGH